MRIEKSKFVSLILNLLMPGLGHLFWKEYIFGLFVFLIVLIGVILFFVSFFIELSTGLIVGLLSLPIIFYFFTFVDLLKTIQEKAKTTHRTRNTTFIFIVAGFIFQIGAPITPVNFMLRNFPEYFIVEQNNLSPLFYQGDILKADRLTYIVDIFFLEKPLLRDLPKRYEIIRFYNTNDVKQVGLVIGLPKEEIEMVTGVLLVDGNPDIHLPPGNLSFIGDLEWTRVDDYSILVATLKLGTIDNVYEIEFSDIIGKVEKVF